MELVIKNYRCFGDGPPVVLPLDADSIAFLGTNNSGKSTLLRLAYDIRMMVNSLIPGDMRPQFLNQHPHPGELADWPHDRNMRHAQLELRIDRNVLRFDIDRAGKYAVDAIDGENVVHHRERNGSGRTLDVKSIFVRSLLNLHNAIYIPAFRSPVSPGQGGDLYDTAFGTGFIGKWDALKRGDVKSQNELCDRVTRDVAHLLGVNQLDISASQRATELRLLIDGKAYALGDVGAGMAHVILCLATVAMRRPTYICIDEPETGLHPSLQIEFLNALAGYATHGLWIATHNYGLARSCSETIFTVRRADHRSEVHLLEGSPHLSVLLGELSYGSYTSIGGTRVLLVEGPSEVKFVQQLLRKIKRDHHVIVLNMGGSAMIDGDRQAELDELRRITPDVVALIDSELESKDGTLEPKRQHFVSLCKTLNIRCHVLERRATENYLTDRAAKAVNQDYRGLGPYELPPKGTAEWWCKNRNWRIAREMDKQEFETTDLGRFLAAI